MLRSLFKSSNSGSSGKGKGNRKTSQDIGGIKDDLAAKEMMSSADRELYRFEAPVQTLGLSDLIAKHKPGDRFQYLALTGGDSETFEARLRRMTTFKPRVSKRMIPINELPHIKLINDSEQLSLSMILPKKGEEYIRLHTVSGYFAPTVSVMSDFSKLKIALMDSRFNPPAEVQSVTLNTNMDAKMELSMDYCIPRSAADKINLILTREQAVMSFGEQWGAIQVQIALEESSFPYMSDMKRVVGILGPTASALEDHAVNPNVLDITMTENNRRVIREFYQQGDIADESEPIVMKKKAVKYAKSSIKALPKGEIAEGSEVVKAGWEHMVGFRKPQIDAEEASEEPSEDGSDDYNETRGYLSKTKDAWEEEQRKMREQFDLKSDTTEEIPRMFSPIPVPNKSHNRLDSGVESHLNSPDYVVPEMPAPANKKRGVSFGLDNV